MVRLTFPQPGDLPDAAYFSSLIGRKQSAIVSGLGLNPDFSVPETTVNAGKAVIDRGDMTTSHPDISPAETVRDAAAVVEIDAQTIGLTSNAINHIYLDANVGVDDSAVAVANTTNSAPSPESFKIGELDTSNNTFTERWNLLLGDGSELSFPDEAAADEQSAKLRSGTIVFVRSVGELFFVD
jgi:hypothetical protein